MERKNFLPNFQPNFKSFSSNLWNTQTLKVPLFTQTILSPKNEKNAIFFPERVATNFRKQKLEISQTCFLPFLHEAATVSEKKIQAFKDF